MRGFRLFCLLLLTAPLLGGSCSFSSSSGDTKIVVTTGDCVDPTQDPCRDEVDEPSAMFLQVASTTRQRVLTSPAPSVPEPSSALLFGIGVALVFRVRRPARRAA
jgi:hypothetical protein